MKRILFTHTDLDGVGCAIIFQLWCMAEGLGDGTDFSTSFCNHYNIAEKIEGKDLSDSEIYFTDIAPSEVILKKLIENYNDKVYVYDHHEFNIGIKEFMDNDHCFIETQLNGINTSGTQILYLHIRDKIKKIDGVDINRVDEFVDHVTAYDTFRWIKHEEEMTPVMLNTYLYLVGINAFKADMINKLSSGRRFFSEDERALIVAKISNDRYTMKTMERAVHVVKAGNINCAMITFEKVNMAEFIYRYLSANKHVDIMIAVNMATGGLLMSTQKDINMNNIGKKFNGGGHKEVAGGSLGPDFAKTSWNTVEKIIVTRLSE